MRPGAGRAAVNDPAFGISWPIDVVVISDQDRRHPDLRLRNLGVDLTNFIKDVKAEVIGRERRRRRRTLSDLPQHQRQGFEGHVKILGREIPLVIHEVPTDGRILTGPSLKEWNIGDA